MASVAAEGALAANIHRQLVARNAVEGQAFGTIIQELMESRERSHILEVRLGQLEKEAAELQTENQTLATTVALAKESETRSEEVQKLNEMVKDLNAELAGVYRDKSKLAEDLLSATNQLQIVRGNNEMQAKELNVDKERIEKMQQQTKELKAAFESEKAARLLATEEMEKRLAAKEAAEKEVDKLRTDNSQLIQTIVSMKGEQADLLNKAVQEHDTAVRTAANVTAAAKSEAAAFSRHHSDAAQRAEDHQQAAMPGEGFIRKGLSMMRFGATQELRRASMEGPESSQLSADSLIAEPSGVKVVTPSRVLARMEAHTGGCYSVAFSHSGYRLASAGSDKTVRLWDPESGTCLSRLEGTLGTVLDVDFTCDDRHVLGAGSDHSLRLWDSLTGRVKHTLTGHTDKVSTVHCSSADPFRAASGSNDRTIKIWNLQNGYIEKTIVCHSSINSVSTTVDGQIVISGHFDGALRFWDLRSGKAINEITGLHSGPIVSTRMCNRSNTILTSSKDNCLKLVDLSTHEVGRVFRGPGHLAGTACLSPDDDFVACGMLEGGVCLWKSSSGAVESCLHSGNGHQAGVQILSADWSPTGSLLSTCDRQGVVVVWSGTQ